jgi:DNA-binding NarL/FixJ family response regulator
MKIIVLDDSLLWRRRLMAKLFLDHGAEMVRGTGDPLEAMRLIKEQKPDVVIMDRRVHRWRGINILRYIRRMLPSPKVMMLTNGFYPAGIEKCLAEEVDFCFDKFTELDEVTRTIRSHRDKYGHACS